MNASDRNFRNDLDKTWAIDVANSELSERAAFLAAAAWRSGNRPAFGLPVASIP